MGRDPKGCNQAETAQKRIRLGTSRPVRAQPRASNLRAEVRLLRAIGVCRDSRLRPTTRKRNDPSARNVRPAQQRFGDCGCGHTRPQHCTSVNVAPAARLLELGLALVTQGVQLVGGHQRQQPLLQGRGELQRQSQIGMPGREGHDLCTDVPFDVEFAQQVEVLSSCVQVSPLARNASLMSSISLSSAGAGD